MAKKKKSAEKKQENQNAAQEETKQEPIPELKEDKDFLHEVSYWFLTISGQ